MKFAYSGTYFVTEPFEHKHHTNIYAIIVQHLKEVKYLIYFITEYNWDCIGEYRSMDNAMRFIEDSEDHENRVDERSKNE